MNKNVLNPLQGAYNFRDLAQIPTSSEQTIKRNLLFRSDELNRLTPSDLDLLDSINVQTIVDFRTAQERAQSIDKIPATCSNEVHLDILSADMNGLMAQVKSGTADYNQIMLDIYKDLVLGDSAQQEYRKFFELLQAPQNLGLIYHCSAGKDRTGIASALILSALGVNWASIEDDYLSSNPNLSKKYEAYISQAPKMADLLLVKSEYLNFAKQSILQHYDTIDLYLQNILNVDMALMRHIYLK